MHSLRTLVRGNLELSNIGLSTIASHHTSNLARVLHDAKEDFGNFKISLKNTTQFVDSTAQIHKAIGKYLVTFDGCVKPYHLYLEPSEAKLLTIQIDALTIPPQVKNMPDGNDKTEAQIQHLLRKTREINEVFGPLEAYQTLRIKIDDRIDNVLTYYSSNGSSYKDKLRAKLQETIIFFRDVQTDAKNYYNEHIEKVFNTSWRALQFPQSDSLESIVQFCYYLLLGGGYEEMLSHTINTARSELNKTQYQDFKDLHKGHFLIPSLNPPAVYHRIIPGGVY